MVNIRYVKEGIENSREERIYKKRKDKMEIKIKLLQGRETYQQLQFVLQRQCSPINND